MKKILSAFLSILAFFIFIPEFAIAQNWVFTAPNSTNTNQYNTYSNSELIESNNSYRAYSSDNAYYGTIQTNTIPEQSYTNTQTTNNDYPEYKTTSPSFSQSHPILTGIGVGALLIGSAAFALWSEDECRRDRDRRPPPPRDRDGSHHHHR